jgi:hypothetical protein
MAIMDDPLLIHAPYGTVLVCADALDNTVYKAASGE